jgi:TctA family transporter
MHRTSSNIDIIALYSFLVSSSPYFLIGVVIGIIQALRDDSKNLRQLISIVLISGIAGFLGKCAITAFYPEASFDLIALFSGVVAFGGQESIKLLQEKVFGKFLK